MRLKTHMLYIYTYIFQVCVLGAVLRLVRNSDFQGSGFLCFTCLIEIVPAEPAEQEVATATVNADYKSCKPCATDTTKQVDDCLFGLDHEKLCRSFQSYSFRLFYVHFMTIR